MPTISVIVPAYNAEKTIGETIESVLAQTYADFELIIVNDGSQDATLAVVNQFTDGRIQTFTYENAGPQQSRNRGIEQARGQYLAFLDADDLWTPDKLKLQLRALETRPSASVAYSWGDEIDQHNKITRHGQRCTFEGEVFGPLLQNNFLASGSNPLVRAEAVRAVGGFDPAIVAGQDWDMWLTLATHYAFVVVPRVQVLYRKVTNSRSWSSNLRRQEQGLMQVMGKHLGDRRDLARAKTTYLAFCYRYLLFECFEKCPPNFSNGVLAVRFFFKAVSLEPCWWTKRYHLIVTVVIKSTLYLLGWNRPTPAAKADTR